MVKFLAALVLAALLPAAVFAAEFTAEVDRKELYVNEHVLLTLSLSDSETRLRAEGVSPNVDLTVLSDDFQLGTPQADFRFNVNRNRGRASSTITVALFPRAPGKARIPGFSVDGASTAPIELRVLPLAADAAPEVFARSGIVRDRLHVGEQTLLYLDLYHRVDIASARFGGSLDSRPRLAVEAHALPAEERSENVSGTDYRVTRSAWAISPLNGDAEIALLLPDIWIETRQGRQWRLPYGEERISVHALPETGQTAAAAIGLPRIETSAPETVLAGQAAPWEFTLRGRTALNALPATAPLGPARAGLRVYMDPPQRRLETTADGDVESVVVYRGFLLADATGEHRTPAITLPYYDPQSGRIETIEVAGTPFRALPSPAFAAATTPAPAPERAVDDAHTATAGQWRWLALALALSWFATLAAWAWQSGIVRRARNPRSRASAAGEGHDPLAALLAALGARTLEQGLRNWQAEHGDDMALADAIRKVQRLRYRPADSGKNAAELETAIAAALRCLNGRSVRGEAPAPGNDIWSPAAFHRGDTRPGRESR
jgi:hypothetical protein